MRGPSLRPRVRAAMALAALLSFSATAQDVKARTTVGGAAVVLYNDGGWAPEPGPAPVCSALDAGVSVCLPAGLWSRIPNPDFWSYTLVFRGEGRVAHVTHVWPVSPGDPSAARQSLIEGVVADVLPGAAIAADPSHQTEDVSVMAGAHMGRGLVLAARSLPQTAVLVQVETDRTTLGGDDWLAIEALLAGLTLHPAEYQKAYPDGG